MINLLEIKKFEKGLGKKSSKGKTKQKAEMFGHGIRPEMTNL